MRSARCGLRANSESFHIEPTERERQRDRERGRESETDRDRDRDKRMDGEGLREHIGYQL